MGLDTETVGAGSPRGVGEDAPTRDVARAPSVATGPREGLAFEVGAKLGRYVLLRELGRGGMAVVYVAYDPELDRRIALKLVRPQRGSSTSADQERLLREAQALARLSHPNVVVVYDVGIYEAHVFIAMELVRGQTLRAWLEHAPRRWQEVLAVCIRAGRGLAAAHAAGLVHLDFKPGNVLIGEDGGVWVVDFGLAREPRATGSGNSGSLRASKGGSELRDSSTGAHPRLGEQLTEHGTIMGTPGYIAPEQLRGEPPDARADQFSYCVTLWRSLFGQRPFLADDRRGLQRAVLSGKIAEPPGDRRVPVWLRRIVERGLRPRPDDRFRDMNALLDALERDPRRRRRRLAGAAAVLAALGMGGYGTLVARAERCRGGAEKIAEVWAEPRREAVRSSFESTGLPFAEDAWRGVEAAIEAHGRAWETAYLDACEATHVRGEQSAELLDLRMHCLERSRGELGALVDVFTTADETVVHNAVEAVAKLAPVQRCTHVVALRAEGRSIDPELRQAVDAMETELARASSLVRAGHSQEAMELVTPLLERARALGVPALEARVSGLLGTAYMNLGRDEMAKTTLMDAVLATERGGVDAQRAEILIDLGYLLGHQKGDIEGGMWCLRLAREVLHRLDDEGALLANAYTNEAVLEAARGRPDAALPLLHQALEIWRGVDGHQKIDLATISSNLGSAHYEKGEYEEALRHYTETRELRRAVFGDEHPTACHDLENLGNVLHSMGRSEEALEHHERATEICRAIGGKGRLQHAHRLSNQATVLTALSRHEEALEKYREALEYSEGHPSYGVISSNFGELLLLQGEAEAALARFQEGVTVIEEAFGRDQIFYAAARAGVGRSMSALGRSEEAVPLLKEALEILEHVTADTLFVGEVELDLARALVASASDRRTRERALSHAERARDGFEQAGDRGGERLAEAEAWLRAHDSARPKKPSP
jgi:eukaryotic-like serine/threonine-protein kinase